MSAAQAIQNSSSALSNAFGQSERLLTTGSRVGDNGRYRIVDLLAIGGMATVYHAYDEHLASDCALKTLFLPDISDPEEAAAFKREAMMLASLCHPGIVSIRDYFVESDFAILVMDLVVGENVYDRNRRTARSGEDPQNLPIRPLPEDQVVQFGIFLSETLGYLHTRSPWIVYRDLKPHNIMRRASDGAVILLDFGIARRSKSGAKTLLGDDLGTPGYAAPEQYENGGKITPQTDIFGLGVVLHELATGYNPRDQNSPRIPPPAKYVKQTISPMLAEILQRCLMPEPADRFSSMLELRDALRAWQQTPRSIRSLHEPSRLWTVDTIDRATGPLKIVGSTIVLTDRRGTIFGFDTVTGRQQLRIEPEIGVIQTPARLQVDTAIRGDGLGLISHSAHFTDGGIVTIYRAAKGTLRPLKLLSAKTGHILTSLTASGSIVIATSEPSEISVLTPASQSDWQRAWRLKLPGMPVALQVIGEQILMLTGDGLLLRLSFDGDVVWRTNLHRKMNRKTIGLAHDKLLIYGSRDDGTATCIELNTGVLQWQTSSVGASISPGVLIGTDRLIIPTVDAGMVRLDITTGRIIERYPEFPRPVVGCVISPLDKSALLVTEFGSDARFSLFDTVQGKIVWSCPNGDNGSAAAPVVLGKNAYVQETNGKLTAYAFEIGGAPLC